MPKPSALDFTKTFQQLPPQQPDGDIDAAIAFSLWERFDVVIVLDDDPTGTQTVYDIPVVTELTEAALLAELQRDTPLFYLLTNSRSLSAKEVSEGSLILGRRIVQACARMAKRPLVIIRGDSTLRGHFDHEDRYLAAGLGRDGQRPFLIPAFLEGGRYTINDVHYVREGNQLIPAAQTPFADDSSFGYEHSNLLEWVKEKSWGKQRSDAPTSISITNLRTRFPTALRDKIIQKEHHQTCVVNAADYTDLKRAALYILRFAKRPLLRTSASFIKALLGQEDRPPLSFSRTGGKGALFLVGSHVPKTTQQLATLQQQADLSSHKIDVAAIVNGSDHPSAVELAGQVNEDIAAGRDVLLYTSREVITAADQEENLDIARLVADYCRNIIKALTVQPSLLLTKGGITSSVVATEALGVKRALALGQVQPGVPTWELGPESKFPGLPFVIYPGNVGAGDGLVTILTKTLR